MTAAHLARPARAVVEAGEAKTTWKCFHCGESFTIVAEAEAHFGRSEHSQPACQIDAATYRAMQERMHRYNREDSDLHRQIARMESDHRQALQREEETGYAKGLRDARLEAGEFASIRERWNIDRDGADLLVCFNAHEKSEGCRYERFVPARESAQPVALADVVAAIRAVSDEARRRGSMFPQTADDQREDLAAVRNVIATLEWYEKNTGCARIKGWPTLGAHPPAPAVEPKP
jgi:hypothetical protein